MTMTNNKAPWDELKACPFCGFNSHGSLLVVDDEYGDWVKCQICGAHGPYNSKSRTSGGREFEWNTRAAMAPGADLRDAAEELVDASREYRKLYELRGGGHIDAGRAWDQLCRAEKRMDSALASLPAHTPAAPRDAALLDEQPDNGWQEEDGCPTEMAVLKRFWREKNAPVGVQTVGDEEVNAFLIRQGLPSIKENSIPHQYITAMPRQKVDEGMVMDKEALLGIMADAVFSPYNGITHEEVKPINHVLSIAAHALVVAGIIKVGK